MSQSTDTTTTKLSLQQIAELLAANNELRAANDGLMQSVMAMNTFNDKLSKQINRKDQLIAELQNNAQIPMSSSSKQALISELQNLTNEQSSLIERQNERIAMLDTENQELSALLVKLTY